MAESTTTTGEVKLSPVGTTKPKDGKNKDGFVAGQEVNQQDYFKFKAQQNNKK